MSNAYIRAGNEANEAKATGDNRAGLQIDDDRVDCAPRQRDIYTEEPFAGSPATLLLWRAHAVVPATKGFRNSRLLCQGCVRQQQIIICYQQAGEAKLAIDALLVLVSYRLHETSTVRYLAVVATGHAVLSAPAFAVFSYRLHRHGCLVICRRNDVCACGCDRLRGNNTEPRNAA